MYKLTKEIDIKEVKELLLNGGKSLFIAGVGKGKTYNFINVCKEIIKNNSDEYLTLFLTPTRTLSEQNGEQYNIHTVVSGINEIKSYDVNTIVYDKLNLIIDNIHRYQNKKIILIVDEAHELIYAKNYRNKTLERIKALEEIAHSIIHLTATPTANKTIYEYQNIIEVRDTQTIKKVNVIEVERNSKGETGEGIEKALINHVINRLKQNKKVIVQYNTHDGLNKIKTELVKVFPSKKISLMTSQTKELNEDFEHLIQNNKINDNIDLVLSTSVLNAGINIKNKDIELIYVIDKNGSKLDFIKQFSGRTRCVNTSFTIIKYKNEDSKEKYIKSFEEELKEEFNKGLEIALDKRNKLENILLFIVENSKGENYTQGITYIKNYKTNKSPFSSCILYNEDKMCIEIDKELLLLEAINNISRRYNKLPSKQFEKLLKDFLKCDSVEFIEVKETEEGEEITQNINQSKKEDREKKKEFKTNIVEDFKILQDDNKEGLTDILKSKFEGEEVAILKDLINSKPLEVRELYNKIITNDEGQKILRSTRSVYKKYHDIYKDCIKDYIINKFDDKCFKAPLYRAFNKAFRNLEKLTDEEKQKYFTLGDIYLNIRFTLDSKIQKRLSQNDILTVYSIITRKKVKPLEDLTQEEKEKTLKTINKKVFSEIKLIYNIQKDNKGYKISSLIK